MIYRGKPLNNWNECCHKIPNFIICHSLQLIQHVIELWIPAGTSTLCGQWEDWEKLLSNTLLELKVCCLWMSVIITSQLLNNCLKPLVLIWSTCTAGRDSPIHLGRTPQNQCSSAQLVCGGCQPFRNERIIARDDATFLAQIGPSGNERGYMGITG